MSNKVTTLSSGVTMRLLEDSVPVHFEGKVISKLFAAAAEFLREQEAILQAYLNAVRENGSVELADDCELVPRNNPEWCGTMPTAVAFNLVEDEESDTSSLTIYF